jgi:hypothetical protein
MRLQPIRRAAEPSYPSRHQVFSAMGGWMRRAAGALSVSSALLLGACYGATPLGPDPGRGPVDPDPVDPRVIVEPPPGPFQPPVVLGGEAMPPSFSCAAERPEPPEWIDSWGYFEGSLCGEESAWAFYEVTEEGLYRLSLLGPIEWASVVLLGPDDAEVALVDQDAATAEVRLAPGLFVLAATATDPVSHPSEWISVSLERIDD